MKKIYRSLQISIFISTLSLFLPSSLEAVESKEYIEAELLIHQDLNKNEKKIQELAESLSVEQRATLYLENKKNPWMMIGLNTVFGFGIGSYIGGDIATGIFSTILDTLSLAGMIAGPLIGPKVSNNFNSAVLTSGTIMIASILLFSLTRLYQGARPIFFVMEYNNKLKSVLLVPSRISMFIAPTIDQDLFGAKDHLGVTAGVAFHF